MICYEEPSATLYQGHALMELAMLPDNFVDCVMTSPPYWGLRTYKTEPQIWGDNHCEHEWGQELIVNRGTLGNNLDTLVGTQTAGIAKEATQQGQFCLKCNAWRGELGLEPTIELYISHLIQIFNEVKRVLKKTGTCWVNIDDSYASGKGTCFNPGGGSTSLEGHGNLKDAKAYPLNRGNVSALEEQGLSPKSLCLIPQRFAIAMVEQGWILRNDICWKKPNPMPESVKDRFTGSWEHLYFFVKNKTYWFEQQFERQQEDSLLRAMRGWDGSADRDYPHGPQSHIDRYFNKTKEEIDHLRELGRNKRDVWEITTQPYPEAHFATFPEKLCETPILAGCPSAICKKCGKAREKVYEGTSQEAFNIRVRDVQKGRIKHTDRIASLEETSNYQEGVTHTGEGRKQVGYTDCGCNAGFESGIVLDPFAGSGATGAVAKRLGRKYIGIELSEQYCKLHKKRLQRIPIPMELI